MLILYKKMDFEHNYILQKYKSVLLPFLLFAISFSVFIPSLNHDFVWDDNIYIIDKLSSLNAKYIPRYVVPESDVFVGHKNYYRPVLLVSLSIDNEIWDGNPLGFHLTNMVLHSLSTVLVYFFFLLLIRQLLPTEINNNVAFLSALLFAIHPIHVEAVSFVMARSDLLCTIFLLLSIIFYILSKKSVYYLIPCAVSIVLCVMSKEIGIVAPVLIFIYDLISSGFKRRKTLIFYIACFCILILYFVLRSKTYLIFPEDVSFDLNLVFSTALSLLTGILYYFYKLIFPFNFNAYVLEPPLNPGYLALYVSIFLAVVVACIFAIRKKRLIYFFGILWVVITILPALLAKTLFLEIIPYSERFAYY